MIIMFFMTFKEHNNIFKEKDPDIVMEAIKQNEIGIYVFGFEDCPWCQDLYPTLENELSNNKLSANLIDIHKKNFSNDNRSQLKKIVTSKTTFDDIVVPLVIMISRDGYFQYQIGTVDGYDASKMEINENQKKELGNNLNDMIKIFKNHNQ